MTANSCQFSHRIVSTSAADNASQNVTFLITRACTKYFHAYTSTFPKHKKCSHTATTAERDSETMNMKPRKNHFLLNTSDNKTQLTGFYIQYKNVNVQTAKS